MARKHHVGVSKQSPRDYGRWSREKNVAMGVAVSCVKYFEYIFWYIHILSPTRSDCRRGGTKSKGDRKMHRICRVFFVFFPHVSGLNRNLIPVEWIRTRLSVRTAWWREVKKEGSQSVQTASQHEVIGGREAGWGRWAISYWSLSLLIILLIII